MYLLHKSKNKMLPQQLTVCVSLASGSSLPPLKGKIYCDFHDNNFIEALYFTIKLNVMPYVK